MTTLPPGANINGVTMSWGVGSGATIGTPRNGAYLDVLEQGDAVSVRGRAQLLGPDVDVSRDVRGAAARPAEDLLHELEVNIGTLRAHADTTHMPTSDAAVAIDIVSHGTKGAETLQFANRSDVPRDVMRAAAHAISSDPITAFRLLHG